MRSSLKTVSAATLDRLAALFEQAEALAGELSAAEGLDAIGRAARLEAVLRARYAALTAPSTPLPQALPELPRYLDAAAAADYLGVSKSTVLRLAKAGLLRALRPSENIVRFDCQNLDRFMDCATPASTEEPG